MTPCEALARQLWPYLDGAVSDDRREEIVAHLDRCASCASHVGFAREFLGAVASTGPRLPIDEALRSRVVGALAAEGFSLSG